MNETCARFLGEVLEDPAVWDKDREKLRYKDVIDAVVHYRDYLFHYQVVVPRYNHMLGILRAVCGEDDRLHFVWDEDLWATGIGGWAIWGCAKPWCTIDNTIEVLQEGLSARLDNILLSDEWNWPMPSEEELLAMGVRPKMVQNKRDSDSNLQLSMF